MKDRISKLTPFHVSLIYTIGLNSIELVYGDVHCIPEVCTIKNNFFVVLEGLSAPQKKILKLKRIPRVSGAPDEWRKTCCVIYSGMLVSSTGIIKAL